MIRDTLFQSSSKFFQLSQIGHVKGSFITFDQIIVSMVQLHFRQNFSMRGSSYELSLVIAGFLTSKPPNNRQRLRLGDLPLSDDVPCHLCVLEKLTLWFKRMVNNYTISGCRYIEVEQTLLRVKLGLQTDSWALHAITKHKLKIIFETGINSIISHAF